MFIVTIQGGGAGRGKMVVFVEYKSRGQRTELGKISRGGLSGSCFGNIGRSSLNFNRL